MCVGFDASGVNERERKSSDDGIPSTYTSMAVRVNRDVQL